MKINKEDFEKFAQFIHSIKKYDPNGKRWVVELTDVHQKDDLTFNRFILINDEMVELM